MKKLFLPPALVVLLAGVAYVQPAATQQPSSGAAGEPASGTAEKPPTGAAEKPASGTAEKPPTGAAEKPASGTAEKPPTGAAEKPASGTAEKPSNGAEKPASGESGRQQGLSDQDRKFLHFAAQDHRAEIRLCRYAEKKAQSPAIKAFARLMVEDHAEVESRVTKMINGKPAHTHAQAHVRPHAYEHAHWRPHTHAHVQGHKHARAPIGVKAPNGAGHGEEIMSKLKDKSGAEFDSAFIAAQIEYHSHDLEKYNDEAKNASNPGVRRFASDTADALKQHLELAKTVKQNSGEH